MKRGNSAFVPLRSLDHDLPALRARIRACRVCAAELPLGARPIVQAGTSARLLIGGQAPGARVHTSAIPVGRCKRRSTARLARHRARTFPQSAEVAIAPIGFCYPGRGGGGDLPPRKECAPLWMARLLARLPRIELTLLIGRYAQQYFLGAANRPTLTETVAAFAEYAPRFMPLPHPSPRNSAWFERHPWFQRDLLPVLRGRIGICWETSHRE